MTVVHKSPPFPSLPGGTVELRLELLDAGGTTEIRIDREERLSHKTLTSVVLRIREPSQGIEPLARAMTTVVHELERLHRQGYTLRDRAGGGWRGSWRSDLVGLDNARTVASWESELRKPRKNLEPLANLLRSLDIPRPRVEASTTATDFLVAAMREHGDETRRNHAIDALIAADPLTPTDEFIEELDERGLLAPPEDPTD